MQPKQSGTLAKAWGFDARHAQFLFFVLSEGPMKEMVRLEGREKPVSAQSSPAREVWRSIDFLPNTSREDCHVWKHSATGQCTIKTAWNLIRINRLILSGGFMWHSWHIPRHSFILWLASKGRLRTMDRLHNPSQPSTNCCVLCSDHEEDHNHLFFDCVYSAEVWQAISQRAQIRWPNLQWSQAWDWVSAEFNSKKNPRHNMGMLVLAATVYHLWCERNRRLFKQVFCSSQRTTNDVIQAIRIRLANTGGRESFPIVGPWVSCAGFQALLLKVFPWHGLLLNGQGPGEFFCWPPGFSGCWASGLCGWLGFWSVGPSLVQLKAFRDPGPKVVQWAGLPLDCSGLRRIVA
ncbi:hypothetical protein DKX38_001764 [Salix brachista]|uniref:Reverse transcriptase zinc-binding domain-containing protein n=1 Tax=Salix brachista TaxID=2182728 RepID=A0A5N5NN53_9ROSI|nr:hypothetical protein DKX38_001764 [Salix brachista]